jgi:diamine N-acetyltransferase
MTDDRKESPEIVYLRALEMGDLARIHRWHNDHQMYASLTGLCRFVSLASVERWLRERTACAQNEVALAICLTNDDTHVGNVYLKRINWTNRHAALAIFIGDDTCRSKGYGSAALRLIVKHAFEDLGLHRLHLEVLSDNERAIKLYERCEFKVEGRLRKHVYKGGQFKDVLLMGLCVEDIA